MSRLALGLRSRKRHVGSEQRVESRRIADALGSEVPARRRGQRHGEFRHANARDLVAVRVDPRHEEGKRGEVSRVHASGPFDRAGIADTWNRGEADRLQRHQRLVAQRRMTAVRRTRVRRRPTDAPREAVLA